MDNFSELLIGFFGAVAIISNLYYQYQHRKINDSKDLINTLIAQRDAQKLINDGLEEEVILLKQEKHNYKNQYHNLLIKSKELESELKGYKEVCNIPHESKLD
jgi:hypothetical protein